MSQPLSTPPTEYRLALPDHAHQFGLMLSRAMHRMSVAEVARPQGQLAKPVVFTGRPPTAREMTRSLACLGLIYVEALEAAAEQRRKDVESLTPHPAGCICIECGNRR